jgi:hypothetical protein
MSTSLAVTPSVPENLLEIFNTIHEFVTSADFVTWLTNGQFNHHIYENRIEEGKYKRSYQYDFEGHIFFQGKIEVDLSHFLTDTVQAFTNRSLLSLENPAFTKIGKTCISQIFVEPYYTVISHGLYKTKIAGMVWEIYNLQYILPLYQKKTKSLQNLK